MRQSLLVGIFFIGIVILTFLFKIQWEEKATSASATKTLESQFQKHAGPAEKQTQSNSPEATSTEEMKQPTGSPADLPVSDTYRESFEDLPISKLIYGTEGPTAITSKNLGGSQFRLKFYDSIRTRLIDVKPRATFGFEAHKGDYENLFSEFRLSTLSEAYFLKKECRRHFL